MIKRGVIFPQVSISAGKEVKECTNHDSLLQAIKNPNSTSLSKRGNGQWSNSQDQGKK